MGTDAPVSDDASIVWSGAPTRLDRALREAFPQWGRADVDAAISTRRVRVNTKTVWMSSWKVAHGDRVSVHLPPAPKPMGPEAFDADWLLADEGEYLVLNKPEGLRSEATRASDNTPNLLSLLRAAKGEELVLAHRLDRDTSGLIVATRPGPIRAQLNTLFSTHSIQKGYVAIVRTPNDFAAAGTIDCFVAPDSNRKDMMRVVERGGKRAVTDYEIIDDAHGANRVALSPRTGRTHQLRVHCALLGGPILGDAIYGPPLPRDRGRLHLHAETLNIPLFTVRSYCAPAPF